MYVYLYTHALIYIYISTYIHTCIWFMACQAGAECLGSPRDVVIRKHESGHPVQDYTGTMAQSLEGCSGNIIGLRQRGITKSRDCVRGHLPRNPSNRCCSFLGHAVSL